MKVFMMLISLLILSPANAEAEEIVFFTQSNWREKFWINPIKFDGANNPVADGTNRLKKKSKLHYYYKHRSNSQLSTHYHFEKDFSSYNVIEMNGRNTVSEMIYHRAYPAKCGEMGQSAIELCAGDKYYSAGAPLQNNDIREIKDFDGVFKSKSGEVVASMDQVGRAWQVYKDDPVFKKLELNEQCHKGFCPGNLAFAYINGAFSNHSSFAPSIRFKVFGLVEEGFVVQPTEQHPGSQDIDFLWYDHMFGTNWDRLNVRSDKVLWIVPAVGLLDQKFFLTAEFHTKESCDDLSRNERDSLLKKYTEQVEKKCLLDSRQEISCKRTERKVRQENFYDHWRMNDPTEGGCSFGMTFIRFATI